MDTVDTWDWSRFRGSAEDLKRLRRDLPGLDTVLRYVPGRTLAVQAGGNLGLWPKRLAVDFDRVLTFEPFPSNYAKLCHNAPEPNIYAEMVALGDTTEGVALDSQTRRDGRRKVNSGTVYVCGPGSTPCRRLDDLSLDVCDLLCLDVEGYELHALRGAAETLGRCRPVVTVEVNAMLAAMGITLPDVEAFFASHQYRPATLTVEEQAGLQSDRLFIPCER